jgi:hypothetical protein
LPVIQAGNNYRDIKDVLENNGNIERKKYNAQPDG